MLRVILNGVERMKKVLAALVLLFALLLGVLIMQNYLKNTGTLFTKTPTATIDDHKFKLKVARSAKEKEIGLSEEKSLPKDYAMLFIFDKADYYSFWMKNMNFPIDIIFIRDGTIVTIYENAAVPKTAEEIPPIYQSKTSANSVLEINSGLSSEYDFKEGDRVKLENVN